MQDCKDIIIKHHQLVEVSITGTHCEPDQGAGTQSKRSRNNPHNFSCLEAACVQ